MTDYAGVKTGGGIILALEQAVKQPGARKTSPVEKHRTISPLYAASGFPADGNNFMSARPNLRARQKPCSSSI